MRIGKFFISCLLIQSCVSAQESLLEDTCGKIDSVFYNVEYCKFLTWKMYHTTLDHEEDLEILFCNLVDIQLDLLDIMEDIRSLETREKDQL